MTEHDVLRIYREDPPSGKISEHVTNPKDILGNQKPALHLIPQAANLLEAMVLDLGAKKYGGEFNWRAKPIRASIYISASMRHLAQWLDGQDADPESGVSHLAHARACLGILLDALATGHLIDDRPPAGSASELIEWFRKKGERRMTNQAADTAHGHRR